MMKRDDLLFALSLCRKAGALVTGFDAVKESVFKGKAQLVLCACDASPGTARRAQSFCQDLCDFYTLPRTQAQLDPITKKPTAVFAVTNADLAQLCRTKLESEATMKEERP